jgi:hypothetical protein
MAPNKVLNILLDSITDTNQTFELYKMSSGTSNSKRWKPSYEATAAPKMKTKSDGKQRQRQPSPSPTPSTSEEEDASKNEVQDSKQVEPEAPQKTFKDLV